ncbi:MAG: tRNA (adenosine(37)-N6)-threonylcarbamoyltransferase complex ATPase subunit type 1 TsaE [Candidatus Paceibacterota bacterium]
MKYVSKSIKETADIAAKFLEKIEKLNKSEKAVVVGLDGDLGSGKTAFTKEIANILGVKETVTSPTFVIEKTYKLKNQKFNHLIHIDAYRLASGSELTHLGWSEISSDPKNLIFIEWPEIVKDILPDDMIKINFEFIDETTREITFE